MDDRPESRPTIKQSFRIAAIIALCGMNAGIALRFWRAFMYPPDPRFTLDWSPLVYLIAGLTCGGVAIRLSKSAGEVLSQWQRRTILAVNWLAMTPYLVLIGVFLYKRFALLA